MLTVLMEKVTQPILICGRIRCRVSSVPPECTEIAMRWSVHGVTDRRDSYPTNDPRLDIIWKRVEVSVLPGHFKQLAQERLNLAAEYIDNSPCLTSPVKPGRLTTVDMRDEFIEKDEALGLFVALMPLFAQVRGGH
ncbi:hypothetical protein ACFQVC_21495 [Streptomyces monticola]|uniref:Uncharacterized protein n=1 Tax=Streptomyces monticola TaxID=2666263 RepID=A0ABW2JLM9_9ACTN